MSIHLLSVFGSFVNLFQKYKNKVSIMLSIAYILHTMKTLKH